MGQITPESYSLKQWREKEGAILPLLPTPSWSRDVMWDISSLTLPSLLGSGWLSAFLEASQVEVAKKPGSK